MVHESNQDLDKLSVAELDQLIIDAEQAKSKRSTLEKNTAYHSAIEIAESVGMTLDELLEYGSTLKSKTKSKSKVEPKYRNEKNETWTGRGKQPKWVQLFIENGGKLTDLLIK